MISNTLPVLYVGYDGTSNYIVQNLSFINRQLGVDSFWTMNRLEDRYLYNRDLEKFIIHCENKLIVDFDYQFINPFNPMSLGELRIIVEHIIKLNGVVHYDGSMVYFQTKSSIIGFNLEFGEIAGISRNRIDRFIQTNKLTTLLDSDLKDYRAQFQDLNLNVSELLFIREKFAVY